MNELRKVAALQARVYEFLEQQDESTLQAILDGKVQLAVLSADNVPIPAAYGRPKNLTALKVDELKAVAKKLGLPRYSSLKKTDLIDLISRHEPVDDNSRPEQKVATPTVRPAPEPPPTSTPASTPTGTSTQRADAAAIAARLRETETEQEGAEYLREQHLDRVGLLAVAAELGLSRIDRLRPAELEKKVLKQAIGARRKFAGLRKW